MSYSGNDMSYSGNVSLTDSTVRDCSAGSVRRVELDACRGSAVSRGSRDVEGRGCLTSLSPRKRSTAASSLR